MSEITVQLSADVLQEATHQAILGIMTPEQKEKLISDAIRTLLAKPTSRYDNRSPLEVAFVNAVEGVARQVAKEAVEANDEIKKKITLLMIDAATKALGVDSDKLAQKMADAFIASCRKDY